MQSLIISAVAFFGGYVCSTIILLVILNVGKPAVRTIRVQFINGPEDGLIGVYEWPPPTRYDFQLETGRTATYTLAEVQFFSAKAMYKETKPARGAYRTKKT